MTSKQNKNEKIENILLPILSVLCILVVWQMLCTMGILPSNKVASPVKVYETFLDKLTGTAPDGSTIFQNTIASLRITVAGLILGIVVGVPMGLLMGWYRPVDKFISPIFELIRPIPPLGWIPLSIVWIGVNDMAKIAIIFLAAFIPCVLNARTGIMGTSQVLINVAKTFGASKFYTFRKIGIPSALPMVFAGMRIAMGNTWGTLVAAEMLAANVGLGYMIIMGRQFGRPDIIILGMVVIGFLGYVFTYIFEKIEKAVVRGQEHAK